MLLQGPLGAGKSALARALIRAAAARPALEVPSPSYTLVQEYDTPRGRLAHFDLWRLDGPGGVVELGWDDARAGIVVVEWPDRLGALRPADALEVTLMPAATAPRAPPVSAAGPGAACEHAQGANHEHARNERALIRQAMLLAAGFGSRMRPLTERTAKPLLPLGGRTLIDHALDRLQAVGVSHVVVNTHWQAELVQRHLGRRRGGPGIVLRPEPTLLDTGGAVTAALAAGALAPEPFFVVNGDSFWLDGPSPTLERMVHAFDPAALDGVLLVHRTFQVHGGGRARRFRGGPLGDPAPAAGAGGGALPVRRGAARHAGAVRQPAAAAVQHQRAVGPRDRGRPAARRGA